jgi:thioredoxin reductase
MTKPQSSPDPDQRWDVVVVGGGAAGLSAALILARARRRVLVLDAGAPRNRFAPHMHGVLSRNGYSPLQLVEDGRREVLAADGVIVSARVVGARRLAEGFELTTDDGSSVLTGRLIVATGVRDDLPAIEGLAEQWGHGVVACPYCDGYEARGSAIGVLPASLFGLHKAHLLRPYSDNMTVFTTLVGPVPEPDRRVLEARGIRLEDRPVSRVVSADGVITHLELTDGTRVQVDVVFAEPRMTPLDALTRQLGAEQQETPWGPWVWSDPTGKTSVDGLWVAGNSADPAALVPLAAASGVRTALMINSELVAEDIQRETAHLKVAA